MNTWLPDSLLTNWQIILVPGFGLVVYLFFHFYDHSRIFGGFFQRLFPGMLMQSVTALSGKAGGFVWLGVVPVVLFGWIFPSYPLNWLILKDAGVILVWLVFLIPLPIFLAWLSSRKAEHQQQYPQVREPVWSRRLLSVDLILWALYLLGYEAFFRGFLLQGMLMFTPPTVAVALNVVFYSLSHIPKGRGEAFGAIPLGILLCIATLQTGSFWIAFLVHLAMAFSNELFTLRNHPQIKSPLTPAK